MKTFRELAILESKDSVGIMIGRFQPVTKAHTSIIEKISKENKTGIIYLVKGKKSSEDKEKNPFDSDIQIKMLEKIIPSNISIEIISSAFFVDELKTMKESKFVIYAGSDRVKSYKSFEKYLEDDKTLEVKEIKRTDEDISATKVRDSLKNDDLDTFKSLTPKNIHSMFNELKTYIS